MLTDFKTRFRNFLSRDWSIKAGGFALSTTIQAVMSTLEYKTCYYDPRIDPAITPPEEQAYLYVFWHEYIPYYMYLRGNCNISMLLSTSRDGDLLDRTAHHMGFETVRGSTKANPVSALRGMMRAGHRSHLTMTPDGPRGPRRHFSLGAIFLSSKLRLPIVPLGLGFDRPWRLTSWDRFAVPRPYSRARCIAGPPIVVPRRMNRELYEHYRSRIETFMTCLTLEAEAWARAGSPRRHEVATNRAAYRQHRAAQGQRDKAHQTKESRRRAA